MTTLRQYSLALLLLTSITCVGTAGQEDDAKTRQAKQQFNAFMDMVNAVTRLRSAKNKQGLHDFFCDASKKVVTPQELHDNFTRADQMYDLREIYPPKPAAVLKRNTVSDVVEFQKLPEVKAEITIGTWFEIEGHKVKNQVGEIWRFRHENNHWYVAFGIP